MAVKDIISTRGVLTSAGSRVLSDHLPSDDSTIVERLRSAGAVLLGKLNLSEFAIGGTIDHPFGTPRNPWNTDHSAGASSSGSGIAAAAGLCAGALGSDTGGSIRGPSSFYSIAGIRPTYGRVTRHAVVPMAWSLDTVGPMTRTVEDCAIVLQAIAGRDPRDPSSSSEPVPSYPQSVDAGTRDLRIGLPKEMFDFECLDAEVHDAVTMAVGVLGELGASSEPVSLPRSERSGAGAGHRPHQGRAGAGSDPPRDARGSGDARRAGDAHEAGAAPQHRRLHRQSGYYQGRLDLGRRRYPSPAALAGLPALSVPCGFSKAGLPIGVQIVGRPFAEATLFTVGRAYEAATEWHGMHPEL